MKIKEIIITGLILTALLIGCHQQNKKASISAKKTNTKLLWPEILAALHWFRERRAGNQWGQREYQADVEYYKYLMEKN